MVNCLSPNKTSYKLWLIYFIGKDIMKFILKKYSVFQWILFLFCSFSSIAYATKIDKLVIFGDSLSDDGNLYQHDPQSFPPSPPYFPGRYSNGPVWVEELARIMGLSITSHKTAGDCVLMKEFSDCAYGGAQVHPSDNSIVMQINNYTSQTKNDQSKEGHLFVIWGGGNDYFSGDFSSEAGVDEIANFLREGIQSLISYGAKNILVLNLPDLGKTPLAMQFGPDYAEKISKLTKMHNQKLNDIVDAIKKVNPDIKLIYFDVLSHFDDIIAYPSKYNFKNVTDPCYSQEDERACTNPDEYLFWDYLHPTGVLHHYMAGVIYETLKQNNLTT